VRRRHLLPAVAFRPAAFAHPARPGLEALRTVADGAGRHAALAPDERRLEHGTPLRRLLARGSAAVPADVGFIGAVELPMGMTMQSSRPSWRERWFARRPTARHDHVSDSVMGLTEASGYEPANLYRQTWGDTGMSMPRTISATIAAKRLREVLNAVERDGETFRVERHGKAIAEIRPTATSGRVSRWGAVLAALRAGPQPDAGLAADLESIRNRASDMPGDPWVRSSTPRS
jgi:antitoxin (DNA-binding transcriptional repressor) of toxin-antitoxin stability system